MIPSSDRERWLEARRHIVGASEVAAMLGENPYCSREQLVAEKRGDVPAFAGNEGTDLALALEPAVLGLARQRYGWDLYPDGILRYDGVCARLGATPDAWMHTPWGMAVVQIKITSATPTDQITPPKSGKPSTAAFAAGAPLYYQLQVQAEMAVLDCAHAVLLVLHTGPLALRAYYVPRHDGVIERIRDEVPRFWMEVEK